jgi:hypothetical protein
VSVLEVLQVCLSVVHEGFEAATVVAAQEQAPILNVECAPMARETALIYFASMRWRWL